MNRQAAAERLVTIAESLVSGRGRTADDGEKAYGMINAYEPILRRFMYLVGTLEDKFKFAKQRLKLIGNGGYGEDRAILEAQKTFMPPILDAARDVRKLLNEMVNEMEKSL